MCLLFRDDLFYDKILLRALGDDVLTYIVFFYKSENYLCVEEVPSKIKLSLHVFCCLGCGLEGIKDKEETEKLNIPFSIDLIYFFMFLF